MGHTYTLEFGVETNNVFENNLGLGTRASF